LKKPQRIRRGKDKMVLRHVKGGVKRKFVGQKDPISNLKQRGNMLKLTGHWERRQTVVWEWAG